MRVAIGVVAVFGLISIAAAILLPQYADYTVRAKTSEVLLAAAELKTSITEFHAANRRLPTSQEAARLQQPAASRKVGSLYFDAERKAIFVEANIPEHSHVHGKRIALVAKEAPAGIEWACMTVDLPARELPAPCREPYRQR